MTRMYLHGIISSDELNEKKNSRRDDKLSYHSLIRQNLQPFSYFNCISHFNQYGDKIYRHVTCVLVSRATITDAVKNQYNEVLESSVRDRLVARNNRIIIISLTLRQNISTTLWISFLNVLSALLIKSPAQSLSSQLLLLLLLLILRDADVLDLLRLKPDLFSLTLITILEVSEFTRKKSSKVEYWDILYSIRLSWWMNWMLKLP